MKLLSLLFLGFSLTVFSQQKMEFIYKVTAAGTMYNPLDENSQILKEYILQSEAQLEDLTYVLRISGNNSYWFLQDSNSYSNAHMGKAYGGANSYYFDGKNYIEQREFIGNEFVVKTEPKQFNWELVDETKQVLGYNCKKAISRETKRIKGEDKTFVTVAWYCPELEYSIGPQDFGGLDGLILELTNRKRKFYCTSITPSEKIPLFVMAKPSKGKMVTEEQYLLEIKRIEQEKGLPVMKD